MRPPARRGGLSRQEARERLSRVGPNTLPATPPESLFRRWLRQLRSALIYVLLFALAVDLALWFLEGAAGVPVESIAIGAILLLNAAMGVWQEYRAEHALQELRAFEAPWVWVRREGESVRVSSRDLVPGDLVRLESGGRVPADARLEGDPVLLVDESVLTGESVPVERRSGDAVSSGTLVVRGTGWATVTRTGADSAMGQIASLLGEIRAEPTPLERRLDQFGGQIARWVVALALAIAAGMVAAEGFARLEHAFLFAVALAVAAVPEGLPAVLTLTLALGVERMSRQKAVVRKLAAVEALGSVSVIATDKTGTLTENEMRLRDVETSDLARAQRAAVLASDTDAHTGAGDPLEIALVRWAAERGIDPAALNESCPRRSERSFDSSSRYMRATVQEDGQLVSYVKGAPEEVLARCTLVEGERRTWLTRAEAHAAEGLRVLALAWGDGERESGLEWIGLALFWDPPRPEVPDAVSAARAAGIRVLMVTGDHPSTALAVARRVGIPAGPVVTGAELDAGGPEAMVRAATRTAIFARVTPAHKLALVEALQAAGETVAMTGDGVNDAPALKRADVGIAMGRRGSDVSREVADLLLLDDNFATIVSAIEEGRNIYENIQKFIRFLFSTNVALVLLVALGSLGAAVLGLRDAGGFLLVPLSAVQLLWINIIADGPPALALGLDRTPGLMSLPPRERETPLLDRRALRFVLLTGGVKAAIGLALLVALPLLGVATAATRTAVFVYEALAQLAFAYPSRQMLLRPLRNRWLNAVVVVSALIHPLLVAVPGLREILGLEWMTLGSWGWVVTGVAGSWIFADIQSRLVARSAAHATTE